MTELTDLVDFIAPVYASDPKRRGTAITMATRFLGASSAKWGAVWLDAIGNLAAHYLTVYDPNGPFAAGGGGSVGGPVQSIKTGDWAISFGAAAGGGSGGAFGDGALKQTQYGQEFIRLRDSRAAGKMNVVRPISSE